MIVLVSMSAVSVGAFSVGAFSVDALSDAYAAEYNQR